MLPDMGYKVFYRNLVLEILGIKWCNWKQIMVSQTAYSKLVFPFDKELPAVATSIMQQILFAHCTYTTWEFSK